MIKERIMVLNHNNVSRIKLAADSIRKAGHPSLCDVYFKQDKLGYYWIVRPVSLVDTLEDL